jgi:hypothetical protein
MVWAGGGEGGYYNSVIWSHASRLLIAVRYSTYIYTENIRCKLQK